MNTISLTGTFTANAGTNPVVSKPFARDNRFTIGLADSSDPGNTLVESAATTDNTPAYTQTEQADRQPQEFGQTLSEKIATKTSPEAPSNSAQHSSNTVKHSHDGPAAKHELKAGDELGPNKPPATMGKGENVTAKNSGKISMPTTTADEKSAVTKIFEPQDSKLASVGPVKSAPVTRKPTSDKADTGQMLSKSAANGKAHPNNALNDSILKDLNPERHQTSTTQTKNHSSLTLSESSNSNTQPFEQILSSNNGHAPIVELSSGPASAPKGANNASSNDVPASVGDQVQGSINTLLRQGDQQITIRLNPPELGKVFIKFNEQDNQITGLLEVSKLQTRAQIQQALPQIIRNLAASGVAIKRLEVVLTDQQEQLPHKDQSLTAGQNSWSRQQGSPNPDTQANNSNATGTNELLANTFGNGYTGFTEPPELLITDNSINMLI